MYEHTGLGDRRTEVDGWRCEKAWRGRRLGGELGTFCLVSVIIAFSF